MNFFKLRIFVAVCHRKSFTKAAEALFITQSAVSKSIKELEAAWGIALVIRKGNQIDITEEGKVILVHVLDVLQHYASLESALDTLKGLKVKKIRLGSGSSVTKLILEGITRFFFENAPEVELEIHSGNSASTEALLKTGALDYGIVASAVLDPELHYEFILDDTIWPVCHAGHPLAGKTVPIGELAAHPVFTREQGSATQEAVNRYFSAKGVSFPIKNSVNYNEALLSYFILEKQHIGFISTAETRQRPLWKDIQKITLADGPITRNIYLAYRKSNVDPVFLKEMKRALSGMRKSWAG